MIKPERIANLFHEEAANFSELYNAQAHNLLLQSFNLLKEPEFAKIPVGWSRTDNLWTYQGKIYIPSQYRQTIFRTLHLDPAAAHPGQDALLFTIRKDYYWPHLRQDVDEWLRNCNICQRTKIHC